MLQHMHNGTAPHPAAVQWYSTTHLEKLTSSESLGWTNVELDVAEHGPIPDPQYVPYDDHDVISFLLEGKLRVESRIGGVQLRFVASPGMMFLIPRHSSLSYTHLGHR